MSTVWQTGSHDMKPATPVSMTSINTARTRLTSEEDTS